MALTSRMILGFAAASKASSFTLKTVFSFGFSWDPQCIPCIRVHTSRNLRGI